MRLLVLELNGAGNVCVVGAWCVGAERLPGGDARRHSNASTSRGARAADIRRCVSRMPQGDRDADQTHVLRARRVRHAQGGRHQLHLLRL